MGDFFKVFFYNFFYEINADALIYEINKLSFYDINDKLFELEKLNYSKSKNIKCYEDCSEPNVLTNRIAITSQKYLITTINPVNSEMHANNITVLPTIVDNRDITKYYRNGTQYSVKVLGADGKVVGNGEIVTFNINGVFYNRTTNETGHAKLNINLNPGEYIITAEYKGCKVSNKIKVKSILSAEDLTKKYGTPDQFKAKLVDGEGNPLANTNVTFNINGVFYNRTTDSDGIAKLNINLMQGKYIITSSYNECYISNKITVTA